MLASKEKMKEIREDIKEMVNYCMNGGIASVATDISEFDWYVTRVCSPHEALIAKDAVRVKKGILIEEIKKSNLEVKTLPGQSSFFLVRAS